MKQIMKPSRHLIWIGSKWQAPAALPDTGDLPIHFVEVARMKPRWRHERTLGDAVAASIDTIDDAMRRTGEPYVFMHGFADEASGGQDGVMTERDRIYWDEWASRFVAAMGLRVRRGHPVPHTIVWDHPRYSYQGRIRRDPVERDWIERTLLTPLRHIGIDCGVYGGWSGTTYWQDPATTTYGPTIPEYREYDIPWFIAPYQWRPRGGTVTPDEYKRSMRAALEVGYPSGTWAHWCDGDEMDADDWRLVVDCIREVVGDSDSGFDMGGLLDDLAGEPVQPDPPKSSTGDDVVAALRQLTEAVRRHVAQIESTP